MAQFARPSSDVAFALLGATPVNTAGNRYQNIDESSAVDTDYVYSQNNPGGTTAEFGLSSVTDPASSSGHVLRFRHMQIDEDSGGHPQSANTGGTATTCAWELRQGATVIASGSVNPGVLTTTSVTLTGTEADAITNYADLRFFMDPGGGAGSPANRRAVALTWAEFEVPDAASTVQGSLTADAIVRRTQVGSFTADAALKRTQVGDFVADAIVRRTQTGGFTADAIVQRTQTGAFTADAWIVLVVAGSFTADAVLRKTSTGSFTVDAAVRALVSGSFTANAIKRKTISDSGLGAFQSDAFQNDAFQVGGQNFTVDAWITTGAGVGSFTADAVVRRTQVGSFTADAWIAALSPYGSFTSDAILRRTQAGAALTADAVIKAALLDSLTSDAIVRRLGLLGSFTADAYITGAIFGNFTAEAVLRGSQAGAFVARAFIVNGELGTHIRVDGVDITDDVIWKDAEFTTLVNGGVGNFHFRVKDVGQSALFIAGAEVTLDIDGVRRFGGYLMQPRRTFFFPVEDTTTPGDIVRAWTLTGVDYNIMFQKRVVYNKTNPKNVELRSWPVASDSATVIKYVFDNYTDLFADGFTHDGVENIGSPNPDRSGVVASGGHTFGDAMREINRLLSGVWYFDPYKDLKYVDVDTPNASKSLSDNPAGGSEIGFREFSHTASGTDLVNDAMVWGAGQGSKRIKFARTQDAASQALHGLWQFGEFTANLYKQASVNTRADTIVNGTAQSKRGGKDDKISWHVVTHDRAFVVGQKATIESEVFGVTDVVPIRRMTVTFSTRDDPKFEMVLSHEIDEPWNLFEFWFPKFGEFDFDDGDGLTLRVCNPLDYRLIWTVSKTEAVAVYAPGELDAYSYNPPDPDGRVFLYSTATYRVEYFAFQQALSNNMDVRLWNNSQSTAQQYMGSKRLGTDIVFAEVQFSPPVTGYWYIWANSAPYYGRNHSGNSVTARVFYLSGEDPGFTTIPPCVEADETFIDVGSSLESAAGDGSTATVQLLASFAPGTTRVFLNGYFQRPGFEYNETDPEGGVITFTVPPANGAVIAVFYEATGRI